MPRCFKLNHDGPHPSGTSRKWSTFNRSDDPSPGYAVSHDVPLVLMCRCPEGKKRDEVEDYE
jgi:hypothetical protein